MPDVESRGSPQAGCPLVVLIPVYNDWIAVEKLLRELDKVLEAHALNADILIVDDGSTVEPASTFDGYSALGRVDVLELKRNLGHQRAIGIGIAFVEDRLTSCESLVVMDGDGEDDPRDVPRLLERYHEEGGRLIVFAERTRRSESLTFRVFYQLFRLIHLLLTGFSVRVGNFSVIPRRRMESLVVVSELWNHYASAAFNSRQPYCTVPTVRARRLHGEPRMNFVRLVVHGLSAISVHSELIGVRMLIVAMGLIAVDVVGVGAVVAVRLGTDLAMPGWATSAAGLSLVLLSQAVMLALLFSFVTLSGRRSLPFLPARDYAYFTGRVCALYPSAP